MKETTLGRGETLIIRLAVADPLFKLWEIKSQVRKEGNTLDAGLAGDLKATWDESSDGLFLVLTARNTKDWIPGRYETDVLFTSPAGTVKRSETQLIIITPGVTKR